MKIILLKASFTLQPYKKYFKMKKQSIWIKYSITTFLYSNI